MANELFKDVKSAKQLVISQNSELKFIENPNTGKTFFVCGEIKGYVAKSARNVTSLEELDFGVNIELGIPTLFIHKDTNVLRTFGADLLH